MKQAVLLIDCYLYGTIAILAVVLLVLVYLHGQANHLPNPFVRKNIIYRPAPKARGVLLGQKYGLLAYSPERDEGHIIVMGPSGTGKTSALLIPTLRIWQGTALVVDISGDISANVDAPNKIIFDPTAANCTPYNVFASIDAAPDESERQERLEQLAYLLLPDKANDSEAGIFFAKNGRKMITAALICYYGMGWGFVEICEHFLGHDWRGLLNDIAQRKNKIANMYISSFVGASEQNTAGCKQAADDALKLFATNEKIKNSENFLVFVTQLSILVWYNKAAADVNGKHRPIKQLIRFFHLIHFSSLLIKYENGQSFFDCLFSLRCAAVINSCRQFITSRCD